MESNGRSLPRNCRTCWKQHQPCLIGATSYRTDCDNHERLGKWIGRELDKAQRMHRFSRLYLTGLALAATMIVAGWLVRGG